MKTYFLLLYAALIGSLIVTAKASSHDPLFCSGNIISKSQDNLVFDVVIFLSRHKIPEASYVLRIYDSSGRHLNEHILADLVNPYFAILEISNHSNEIYTDRIISFREFRFTGDNLSGKDFHEDITEAFFIGGMTALKPTSRQKFITELRKNFGSCSVEVISKINYNNRRNSLLEEFLNSSD